MLPLATDADLNGRIIRGLRRRLPDIDLVRVQDVHPDGTPDLVVLEWAAAEGRVLVTHDVSTMVGHAYDRVAAGLPMPGVIVCDQAVSIRAAIEDLHIIATCGQAEDFQDQVQWLPL